MIGRKEKQTREDRFSGLLQTAETGAQETAGTECRRKDRCTHTSCNSSDIKFGCSEALGVEHSSSQYTAWTTIPSSWGQGHPHLPYTFLLKAPAFPEAVCLSSDRADNKEDCCEYTYSDLWCAPELLASCAFFFSSLCVVYCCMIKFYFVKTRIYSLCLTIQRCKPHKSIAPLSKEIIHAPANYSVLQQNKASHCLTSANWPSHLKILQNSWLSQVCIMS